MELRFHLMDLRFLFCARFDPEVILEGYPDALKLAPLDWPPLQTAMPHPGDLTQFLTQGFGLGPPAIVMPYGSADGSFYGFDQRSAHPLLNAPTTESSGGTIYFKDWAAPPDLKAAFNLSGVFDLDAYVAYSASSRNTLEERHLDQMRFVSLNAMSEVYRVRGIEPPPKQTLTLIDAFVEFVTT